MKNVKDLVAVNPALRINTIDGDDTLLLHERLGLTDDRAEELVTIINESMPDYDDSGGNIATATLLEVISCTVITPAELAFLSIHVGGFMASPGYEDEP